MSGATGCGHVDMQGFNVVLECVLFADHPGIQHETRIGQRWNCAGHTETRGEL